MSRLTTSIALATFQGERYLREQLESFKGQTRLPDELCVSDDGSTDRTSAVVQAFAANAPFPVKWFINPKRNGLNKNFEYAVTQCTADVILFSDQDDVWLPGHIENLTAPMESNPKIVAVSSDSEFVDDALRPVGCTQMQSDRFPAWLRQATARLPRDQFGLVLRQNIHSGHGMAFRRSLLPLVLPFTETFMYDEWVFLLSAAAGFVTYAPAPLTLHRQHQNQNFKSRNKELKVWAEQSRSVSAAQESVQTEKWNEVLTRVRAHRDELANFRSAERRLNEKYRFLSQRVRTRHLALPMRLLITSRELLLGRYHRLGRGLLAFARDLYGVRQ